jgi:3-oxoacyl-[acyl-carrier protein] reductase
MSMAELATTRPEARMDGKIAFVTGAGIGMGRTHALLLAARGATVIVHDKNAPTAERTADEVRKAGGKAQVSVCDVLDVAAIRREVRAAENALGAIDVLVNNAGIHQARAVEDITEADMDRMYGINVKGMFFAVQAVVPGMKARKRGRIVNISSAWGLAGNHTDSHYCASKTAVMGLTKSWARELHPWNILVNAIAPGMVLTEMTRRNRTEAELKDFCEKLIPLGRLADPIDLSYAVGYLASEESGYVTGQVFSPNGGEFIVGY